MQNIEREARRLYHASNSRFLFQGIDCRMINIRKNIIAALLNVPSSEVENTELMPTILRKESKDDKYGILDVRVKTERLENRLILNAGRSI